MLGVLPADPATAWASADARVEARRFLGNTYPTPEAAEDALTVIIDFAAARDRASDSAPGAQLPAAPADAPGMNTDETVERISRQLLRAREALEYIALCNEGKGHLPELASRALRSIGDLDVPPTAEG